MSIYRLSVKVWDYQELELGPALSVAADRDGASDRFDLWFENSPVERCGLYVFGTGHPTPWNGWSRHAWHFVGTVVTPSGLVWHVFTGPLEGTAVPV